MPRALESLFSPSLYATTLVWLLAAGCSTPPSALGETCSKSADCEEGLRCLEAKCTDVAAQERADQEARLEEKRAQLEASRVAAHETLLSLADAALASFAEWDSYFSLPPCPVAVPAGEGVPFPSDCGGAYKEIYWEPLGAVGCRFTASARSSDGPSGATVTQCGISAGHKAGLQDPPCERVRLSAECDADDDGQIARYEVSLSRLSIFGTSEEQDRERTVQSATAANVF